MRFVYLNPTLLRKYEVVDSLCLSSATASQVTDTFETANSHLCGHPPSNTGPPPRFVGLIFSLLVSHDTSVPFYSGQTVDAHETIQVFDRADEA
jgi:hypothetical protein